MISTTMKMSMRVQLVGGFSPFVTPRIVTHSSASLAITAKSATAAMELSVEAV